MAYPWAGKKENRTFSVPYAFLQNMSIVFSTGDFIPPSYPHQLKSGGIERHRERDESRNTEAVGFVKDRCLCGRGSPPPPLLFSLFWTQSSHWPGNFGRPWQPRDRTDRPCVWVCGWVSEKGVCEPSCSDGTGSVGGSSCPSRPFVTVQCPIVGRSPVGVELSLLVWILPTVSVSDPLGSGWD